MKFWGKCINIFTSTDQRMETFPTNAYYYYMVSSSQALTETGPETVVCDLEKYFLDNISYLFIIEYEYTRKNRKL